jgi:hypothetical protein
MAAKNLKHGVPRIYNNWATRLCFGKECWSQQKEIAAGEWFVNITMQNRVPSTQKVEAQNIGFCLETEGRCMSNPHEVIKKEMRIQGITVPRCLPVVLRGKEQISATELCQLARKLPNRDPPYVGRKHVAGM